MAGRMLKRTYQTPPPSLVPVKKRRTGVKQNIMTPVPSNKRALLTCGQGDVGQLGQGDIMELTKFRHVKPLDKRVVDACAGGMHTIALDDRGKVWTFGCNDEGALGRITRNEGTPGTVRLPRAAVCITAGDSHSAALLDNGEVYAWGSFRDANGSMGLVLEGRQGKPKKRPVKIPIGKPAAAIASGSDHLVILTTSHTVITLGCGEQGQLGRIPKRSASRESRRGLSSMLTPLSIPLKVSKIWAGSYATFALDAAGERMFAWGLNNYGQLGISHERISPEDDEYERAIYHPRECKAFNVSSGWKMVSCGQHHTLALDGKGQVYAIGRCEYGRLGLGMRTGTAGDAVELEPIRSLGACVSIAAGTSNSSAVTATGEAYSWGMGSEGLLGTGETCDEYSPARCRLSSFTDDVTRALHVSAGGQHTVLLVEVLHPAQSVQEGQSTSGSQNVSAAGDKTAKSRASKSSVNVTKRKHNDEEVPSTSGKRRKKERKERK